MVELVEEPKGVSMGVCCNSWGGGAKALESAQKIERQRNEKSKTQFVVSQVASPPLIHCGHPWWPALLTSGLKLRSKYILGQKLLQTK